MCTQTVGGGASIEEVKLPEEKEAAQTEGQLCVREMGLKCDQRCLPQACYELFTCLFYSF